MQSKAATDGYRADVDGLRCIAVLLVVFYHAGVPFISGGYVGVDVFFVISGYLITKILVNEIEAGRFTYQQFYLRRIKRLFPALFVVLFVTGMVGFVLLMPGEFEDLGESIATTALFTSNFLFFNEAGYFDAPAETKPLLHTWSLAIEEQFYLLFPVILTFVIVRIKGSLPRWIWGIAIISFSVSALTIEDSPNAAFYLLPSRAWELMTGALVALWLREGGAKIMGTALLPEAIGWIGLAGVVFAALSFNANTVFPGFAALLPCVGTAMVLICGDARPGSQLRRVLSLKPLVVIGLISYSLYLWHWPLLVYAKLYLLRNLTAGRNIGVNFGVHRFRLVILAFCRNPGSTI